MDANKGDTMGWCLWVPHSGPDFNPLYTQLVVKLSPWTMLGLIRIDWD